MYRYTHLLRLRMFLAVAGSLLFSAGLAVAAEPALTASSPDHVLQVQVLVRDGQLQYQLSRFGVPVLDWSRLGLQFSDASSLTDGLAIADSSTRDVDDRWQQPWGERQWVRNRYRELRVNFTSADAPAMAVVFRVYDEGFGFRYEVPADAQHAKRTISNELTEFAFVADHKTWWNGAYLPNRYEYLYRESPLSAIWKAVTPLTMKTAQGLYLSVHEAALVDYPEMTLENVGGNRLKADLIPWSDGSKVKTEGAFVTPWRTLTVAERATGLIDSDLILNLNEPNTLGDVSWLEPGKYVGVWWEMHIRQSTWASGDKHGANTANVRRFIDFAAKYGFKGVLVEGWNVGWDGDWIANSDLFNFTTPYPDYDFDALARYAKNKGVRIIGHHETSGGIANYESQLEDAMAYMQAHDVRAIKTGYVKQNGLIERIGDDGKPVHEWQHGQFMVRHYQKVAEVAAKHHIAINTHEPIKDTGLRRTWPNWMTREGARGQEYNAWSEGNGPGHIANLAFTRMLSGPMDFTPGIFDLGSQQAMDERNLSSTLAKQLALYVVLYSPLQMAADLPENYEAKPKAFQFIRDVPADWAQSRAIDGEIGDFVVIARQDRNSRDWYLGAVGDENGRLLSVPLGFLESGVRYQAQIYADGVDASWDKNPEAIEISTREVSSNDVLRLRLAPGGGSAIRFVPLHKAVAPRS